MAMSFYYLSGSPFSWKVWLALEHKRIAYELKLLSADAGDLGTPAFLRLNPRGKVPVIDDGGFVLSESSVIVDYLEDRYGASGERLWPLDHQARAYARRVAVEGDSYIYPHVRKLVTELVMRKSGAPDAAVITEASAALERELGALALGLTGGFMAGDEPTAADFAIYPLLAVLRRVVTRRPDPILTALVPANLASWMRRVEALPYFAKTIPPHWRTS